MSLKKGKILIAILVALYLSLTGLGSSLTDSDDKILLAAGQTTTSSKTNPSVSSATSISKLKNTGNQPVMPLMPVKPANPAEPDSNSASSSVLKKPWESREQNNAGQLKNQWENRRNSMWDKNNNKVLVRMQQKKENIHKKGQGKSSKTEIPATEK